MRRLFNIALMAGGMTLGWVGSTAAQPRHLEPGSVLIFPLFDSRPASTTVISVTNTNQDRTRCPSGNGFRVGDVLLHYQYFGMDPATGGKCLEFDRFEPLTPADTLTVLSSRHNPESAIGFLTVSALDPETLTLIDFDHLIGSAFVSNAALDIVWSYTPYPFEAVNATPGPCGGAAREVRPDTGPLLFDGVEYAKFPDRLLVDSFFEEEDSIFSSTLTLMSTHGHHYVNELDFLFFNNREDKFSRTFKFVCWTSLSLSEISSIARNLGGDPAEFRRETGWVSIDGRALLDRFGSPVAGQEDPAILGVFSQVVRGDFSAGHALHYSGSQANAAIP